ncbi:uncharacterized protein LOC131856795 [Cryptomeria japonica]|uniref:uncharacterized protein LOC131856795 n=1 Tax=Cryptomeria japonica TaxID=3369 RepID=UPI0027DA8542|nr:uncharacterized protein LOC131856795 [Cryptomeria japonica]
MDNTPADGLKKRLFIEGLNPPLRKKMKVVPPSTFMDAYNRVMDIESENKTSKGKKRTSDEDSSDEEREEESQMIQALPKDMRRMMREMQTQEEESREDKELWCTECKLEGHTKTKCPKKVLCDICQVLGHSIKECPYNFKAMSAQVLYTQEQATPPTTPSKNTNSDTSPGGYRNSQRGSNNNTSNNTPRGRIQYDAKGRPMIQCRRCNEWGHFARDCQSGVGQGGGLLCKWCGLGKHEDVECPR